MKILCAGHNFHVHGGSDRYMMELIDLLVSKGDSVIPFAAQSEKNEPTEYSRFFPEGVDTSTKSPASFLRYCYNSSAKKSIKSLLDSHSVDIAHLHIYYGQLTSAILAPIADRKIPIVQTLHEYKLTCPAYTHLSNDKICESCAGKHFHHAVLKKCKDNSLLKSALIATESTVSRAMGDVKRVDHFIAPSEFMRSRMVNHGVVSEDNISVIPYHIDAEKYAAADTKGEHILYFGRLSSVKGLRTLLKAANKAPFKLIVAGTGPLEQDLQDTIEQRQMSNVELVGFQSGDNLRDLVARSVCTVLPSEWYDNYPLAIMESMSQAKPVVGARIGGIPEMIRHEVDGLLFSPANVNELEQSLTHLWRNPLLSIEMGQRARERMIELCNPDQHYDQLAALYSKLLNA